MSKTCKICGEPLPAGSTKRRLYCSDTCRQRAKRARDNESEEGGLEMPAPWEPIETDWGDFSFEMPAPWEPIEIDWGDFSFEMPAPWEPIEIDWGDFSFDFEVPGAE